MGKCFIEPKKKEKTHDKTRSNTKDKKAQDKGQGTNIKIRDKGQRHPGTGPRRSEKKKTST